MSKLEDKILFVDDEQAIIDGLKRQFFRIYNVYTALGPQEGLRVVKEEGPFSVVVSDMRMPVMDGAEFLTNVRKISPDTIRIILTGQADVESAISAVNDGNIFRFMTKPCPMPVMQKVLEASLDQYHLVIAERELLDKTLKGSIKVLVDILSLTNPTVFSRTTRIKYFALEIAKELGIEDTWKLEIAAMLSQIGCVTIPANILEKISNGQQLSSEEEEIVKKSPLIASELISNIPRLEAVSEIIAFLQDDNIKNKEDNPNLRENEVLKVAVDLEEMLFNGESREYAVRKFQGRKDIVNKNILEVIDKIKMPHEEKKVLSVQINQIAKGMVLEEDLKAKNGVLLATKGQVITETMKAMFSNYYKQGNISGNVTVSFSFYEGN